MDTSLFTHQPGLLETPLQGPLEGVKILIQPDLSVKNWPTDAGSQALTGYHAVMDATVLARATAAGAELAGSTQMAELGLGLNGSTMAQCLGQGYGHAGIMTDLMGEARISACMNGWYGFKPSWGRVSRYGLVGLIPSMECTGLIAQRPQIIARVFEQIAGPDPKDPSMTQAPLEQISSNGSGKAPGGSPFPDKSLTYCRHPHKRRFPGPSKT